jgi:glycosyltransferase involved in cell wall biosynthesis
MSNKPFITVGMPIYREAKFIREALDSLINQEYVYFRVVISDNGSDDETIEICQEYVANDDRFTLIQQKENLGILGNFKFVYDQCETKYYIWFAGHDVLLPNYFKDAIEKLESNENLLMTFGRAKRIDINSEFIPEGHQEFIIDDNLHTVGLKPYYRMMTVIWQLRTCIALHGVFRYNMIDNLNLDQIWGTDSLMLYLLAARGEYYRMDQQVFLSRLVRQENKEELVDRMMEYGVVNNINSKKMYSEACIMWVTRTFQLKNLSIIEKCKLAIMATYSYITRTDANLLYIFLEIFRNWR